MIFRKFCLLFIFHFFCLSNSASDLKIEGIEWSRDVASLQYKVKFTISWNNSWRNDKNYDAAWVFLKYTAPDYRQASYRHAKLMNGGHQLLMNHIAGSPNPVIEVPEDRVGLFIYPSAKHRGTICWTIELALDTATLRETNFNPGDRLIDVFAIEMIQIPQAAFTLGEADTAAAWKNYSLFISDGNGRPGGLWKVNSEKQNIPVGKENGNLYYNSQQSVYQGDQKGIIPAEFPKGFQAFYIMKYETTQGQYAAFLNCISNAASASRANFGGKDYYTYRGTIRFEKEKYIAGSPDRPCNYFSWDDACAYADWAGLRPMTELEFEKACRGPQVPIANEFPWNTHSKNKLQRVVSKDDELVWLNGLQESDLTDNNREQLGASYYWVMDLAGSLWERCITIGDSVGRSFKGTHGDGMLAPYGFASNADWPKGNTETAGFGFKGGGYYEHNMQYGGFNPHSPIANRNFGAWPGGARSVAYGSRFVRTVRYATIIK
ncbi:MAG: SUMF1/EgtB/PvdO family nonheme iron enzyme [Chitinophagaceae bacterium]